MATSEAVDEGTAAGEEHAVTPLELFFDLVFVFALTQVTAFYAADATWDGLLDGTLVLGAVWWGWVGYSWLTNNIDPEEGWPRLVILAAMAGFLVAALAIPDAFEGDAGLFVGAIAVVRIAHLGLLGFAPGQEDVLDAVKRFTPAVVVSMTLLTISTGLDGAAQAAVFAVALLVDFGGALLGGAGWKLFLEHFAERHGLIVIIALGESIVALGIGAEKIEVDLGVIAAAVLGIAISGALWWLYFDVTAIVAEHRIGQMDGDRRIHAARDAYSYLHFALILGIVLLALGLKKALGAIEDPMKEVPAVALCAGPAVFLIGQNLIRLRIVRTLSPPRLVATAACLALIPVAQEVSALMAMIALALVLVALVVWEAVVFREFRAGVRSEARGHHAA